MKNEQSCEYGVEDNSYKMAGQLAGITKLVEAFYLNMETLPSATKIRNMHADDLTQSSKKLAYFISGWLGGPKLYAEHFGSINIPMAHKHLAVGDSEAKAWLHCMQKAVDQQDYEAPFKIYLMEQFKVPAKRIQQVSQT